MYAVIMAGGGGTRLWPLSDPRYPKPFLPLFPDGSLLEKTIGRLTGGPDLQLDADAITVVTDQRYEGLVRDAAEVAVLSEPVGRNTAAAIALAALAIEREPDDVMVVLPADHLVADEAGFRSVLAHAADLALGAFGIESPIVTLGAQPTSPATQYGYLVPDLDEAGNPGAEAHVLRAFVEKPEPARAAELIAQPGTSWNAGIFVARRRAWLAALERHTALLPPLRAALDSGDADDLAEAYAQIQPMSIDYAVMQPAAAEGQVAMTAMNVGWSDVGTWTALLDALVSGYAAAARVVPPGESTALGADDLAVLRTEVDRQLTYEPGPLTALVSSYPYALLPDARRYESAIRDLIIRVNERTATPVEAGA